MAIFVQPDRALEGLLASDVASAVVSRGSFGCFLVFLFMLVCYVMFACTLRHSAFINNQRDKKGRILS